VLALNENWPGRNIPYGVPYSMPSCFWISSSGTPFVSGTMVFTQMTCSTIIPAKNAKTYPGGKAATILGKNVVSKAAKIQWVKLPRV